MLRRSSFFLGVLLAVMLLLPGAPAAAHPLGNFTINLYNGLSVGTEQINILYVVDMAEIPTFQTFGGDPAAQDHAAFLDQTAASLRDGLNLHVDGQRRPLQLVDQTISFPSGQGGLLTTRIELRLSADVPEAASNRERSIMYSDGNYGERLGWHEIVVQAAPDARIVRSTVPDQSISDALRAYPDDMLSNPLDVRSAEITFAAGAPTTEPASAASAPATVQRSPDRFAALINTPQLTPGAIIVALLLATVLGAVHALSPGHGKTVVAAYLIGARGTARHALWLGVTVTITHTLGVFALGLITLYASRYVLPEQLYPWLSVMSGFLVVTMGIALLRQRLRALRQPQMIPHLHDHGHDHTHDHGHEHHHHAHADHHHDHDHAHHDHYHHHDHDHDHGADGHSHLPPGADGTPITWRSLLALGISGGLLPCPSALVVMLGAIALGRVGFGLLLIMAFSIGLAGVLTGIGMLFVYGGRWLSTFGHGHARRPLMMALRFLPLVGALVVTVAGLGITTQALAQVGMLP